MYFRFRVFNGVSLRSFCSQFVLRSTTVLRSYVLTTLFRTRCINMSTGFVHSIKVPRLYKTAARIAQTVQEEGAGLKQLIYEKKHPNVQGIHALVYTTLQHGSQLDRLIRDTKILFKEPRLDPWLARVLITELLWGKQSLQSNSKPVQTVLSYQIQLQEKLKDSGGPALPVKHKANRPPRYVRVNTLSTTVKEAISSFEEEGWRLLPRGNDYTSYLKSLSNLAKLTFIQDIHVPEIFAFPPGTQFHDHYGYMNGAIVLQDKASCLPVRLLNVPPGSVVLDMCAAPGIKTTHLAATMQNEGLIYAVERNARRYEALCKIVTVTNCHCVKTINADVMVLNAEQCPDVEYILVDPSCSGSGMVNRLEIVENEHCTPERLKSLQSFQTIVLRHALYDFPSAKRIVYSTCSVYPEENEQVVDEVLADVGDAYRLVPIGRSFNGNWLNFSSLNYSCKDNCLYAKPEVDLTNGFFVALFERNFDVPLPQRKYKGRRTELVQTDDENAERVANDPSKKKRERKRKKKRRKGEEPEIMMGNTDKSKSRPSNGEEKTTVGTGEAKRDVEIGDVAKCKKKEKRCKKQTQEDSPNDVTEASEEGRRTTGRKRKRKESNRPDVESIQVQVAESSSSSCHD